MKEELLRKLFNDDSLKGLSLKLAGSLSNDLLQEVGLVVCETSDKDVERISSYFNFWCVRTMINMTSSTGRFWKKYSDRYYEQSEIEYQIKDEYDPLPDKMWQMLDEVFDKKTEWYKRDILKLYCECGSYRNIEELTKINHVSAYYSVKDAKKILKERL